MNELVSVASSVLIFSQIKNKIFNIVKKAIFNRNGIIFGGAVRDTIISEHYKELYNKHIKDTNTKTSTKKFWDETFHPETALRTILANDIDVNFKSIEESQNFIEDLTHLCIEENVSFKKIVNKTNLKYGIDVNVDKYVMTIDVGKIPFIFDGYSFDIKIDIVIPNNKQLPPFKNLDMLCNGFIMTKDGISLSNNTGTYLDKLTTIEKTIESAKIMTNMIELKTSFCWKGKKEHKNGFLFHAHALKRIDKLINRKFPWTITNIPFKNEIATEENTCMECCICCANYEKNEMMSIVVCEEKFIECSRMHTKCFFKYMDYQIVEAYENAVCDFKNFTLKCPVRTVIDFTKC